MVKNAARIQGRIKEKGRAVRLRCKFGETPLRGVCHQRTELAKRLLIEHLNHRRKLTARNMAPDNPVPVEPAHF